jgi:hypothetical protein
MATKGRGGDSMLVHMTPGEVQALQALAERHGGTLTINPETGQPEANFLKKLLPAIAGAALNFFAPGVGTAVGGMFGLGAAAGTGIAVGGISALATGSLSRGLMAGMGAYGGASLAGSLANAGTGALSSEAGNAALAAEGLTGDAALTSAADDVAQRAIGERLASATPYDKMSAGFKAVTDSPAAFGNFAKNNMQSGLAAISPMMADEGVQTTTPKQDTGNIRRFSFDRFGQTYTPQGVFPAAGYKGMAQGGIVALANGGTPLHSAETMAAAIARDPNLVGVAPRPAAQNAFTQYTPQVINDYIAQNNLSGNALDAAIKQFNVDPSAVAAAQNMQNTIANVYQNVLGRDVDPSGLAYWTDRLTKGGASGQDMYNEFLQGAVANKELLRTGISLDDAVKPFAGYSSADKRNIADEWVRNTLGREVTDADRQADWYKRATSAETMGSYTAAQDIFSQFQDYARQNAGASTAQRMADARQTLASKGLTEADVFRQTGKTLQDLVGSAKTDLDLFRASQLVAPDAPFDFNTLQAARSLESGIGALPGGVSGGGNTVVNPNGTITTSPNIPGRPEGGFTGMGQVRDAYTQGGGSLGYVNPAPKTMEEFEQRFNRQTGDSLAAYNYLMGKGANPATQQRVGEIARPYSEAIVGIPAAEGRPNQKFIYQDGRYVENPNYVPITYDSKGNRNVGMTSAEVLRGFQALPDQTDDKAIFDWVGENQISIAQLAAAMGISVGEAQRRMEAARKKTGATTATSVSDSGYGGDSADVGGGPAGGGVGGAGGPGSTSAADPSDFGGMAMGGQVKRMALGGLGSLAKGGVAELPDGAFVVPARITSELGNGSTNAGAQKLFAMEQRLLGKNAQPVNLGRYSGGGNLVRGKGDGVSDSVPATIGGRQPALIADGESVVSEKAVEKLGNGSTEAGARKLYAMMDRVQKARGKTTGKNRVAANTRADKYLPA